VALDDVDDYESLDEYLEEHDSREFSPDEWIELLEHFEQPLEGEDGDEAADYDSPGDYEDLGEYAEDFDPEQDYPSEFWEDIADYYEDFDDDSAFWSFIDDS